MALYEYRCPDGHTVEVFHKMDETPEVLCEVCGAPSERVISTPMIHTQYYFSTQVRQSRFPRHRSSDSPPASPSDSPPASPSDSPPASPSDSPPASPPATPPAKSPTAKSSTASTEPSG